MESKALLIIALVCCGALAMGLVFWSQIPVTPPKHQDAPQATYVPDPKSACIGERCASPKASYEPPTTCWVYHNTMLICPCPKGMKCRLQRIERKHKTITGKASP